ncbi:hypothetical protein EIP91_001306 [Steccherinum ochraceum]|uniref:Selenoprotein O n=1 Tax=Steccherinum ochraceum TaxID=92696 RepID=A0A4R0RED4_9APHY|nr:hypothetical protein EIP91_001306 [Steccherinum ochraceum]
MSTTHKVPFSSLPLPPKTHILPLNLTPDPRTPSPFAFRQYQKDTPSYQRRARLLASEAHFSYVAPCPIPFPYKAAPEEGEEVKDQDNFIEKWLGDREALHEKPAAASTNGTNLTGLKIYYPSPGKRDQHLELIGLSETGLRDCLPHLHVGDAFGTLGSATLSDAFGDDVERPEAPERDVATREELIEILSGHATLMDSDEGSQTPWAPWSLRYSGHQFGTWAGQLGDGRAISILATPHPDDPELIYELQLKGAGRTPFSRTADGLAVVRSSIREFLCGEAMHALGIPTTRSLSLISLPATEVARERVESACILTRMAPSFLRIGSFEALNPPANMFFFGGGQQNGDWDALLKLGEWVSKRVLRLDGIANGEAWGKKLVLEVARRNARMVAGWQAYGFMHGVINTDNVSILGLTIDYGPFAFMDVFDQYHICNHTDDGGRYAYNQQPSMIMYALRSLLTTLAPLIGAEAEIGGKALDAGWAKDVPKEKMDEWRQKGTELAKEEMEVTMQQTCADEYGRLMHKRLALRRLDSDDESNLARPLLDLMGDHRLDFHATFRRLAYFRPSMLEETNKAALDQFIAGTLSLTPDTDRLERDRATNDLKGWLEVYASRILSERELWGADVDAEREAASKSANPRFVLRQWVLEEVIKAVESDASSGKRMLRKVLEMACRPFDPWGAEDAMDEDSLDKEIKEERRFCDLVAYSPSLVFLVGCPLAVLEGQNRGTELTPHRVQHIATTYLSVPTAIPWRKLDGFDAILASRPSGRPYERGVETKLSCLIFKAWG